MLKPEDKKKIENLIAKATKPPTYTKDELAIPISARENGTFVSTQEYIDSFATGSEGSILAVESLDKDKALALVIARTEQMVDFTYGAGGRTFLKKDVLKELQNQSDYGQAYLASTIFDLAIAQKLIAKFKRNAQ